MKHATVLAAIGASIFVCSVACDAQPLRPEVPQGNVVPAPMADVKLTHTRSSGDTAIEGELNRKIDLALRQGDAEALETLSRTLRENKTMMPSGYLELGFFYDAVDNAISTGRPTDVEISAHGWETALKTVTAWREKYPHSPSAPVALAQLHISKAWASRGQNYASDVSHEQWRGVHKEVAAAHAVLSDSASFAQADPVWYAMSRKVMVLESAEHQQYVALIDEGLRKHPEFLQLAIAGVDYMVPRWGGSDAEVRQYIQHVLAELPTETRPIFYARVYRMLLRLHFYSPAELVALAGADESLLDKDFDEVIRRYPDAYNVDTAAYIACTMSHLERLRTLLKQIGTSPIMRAWSRTDSPNYFIGCKNSADTKPE